MRKSILVTGLIAVVAVTLAIGLNQTDKGKSWFSGYGKPQETTQDMIVSAVSSKTDTATPTTTSEATTTPATETTAAVTPETTPVTTGTETAMTPVNLDAAQAKLNAETPAAGTEQSADTAAATPAAPTETVPQTTFKPDVAAALQDVSIGSANAPITIYDFSSLSCPHCAIFHKEVLPKVKTEYIDTGKVRWVFKGFPLNEAALKAEMVARCAPKDQYIKLEDLMYANQERWAFSDNPIPNLSMLLKLAGITEDMFLGCVNNQELQAALLKKIQEDTDKYKLASTPTFVLNEGEKVINGAGTYEGFAYDLDAMLKAKAAAATPKK